MSYAWRPRLESLMGKHKNSIIIVLGMGWYPGLFWEIGKHRIATTLKPLVQSPNAVKLVVFTGGEDIHPSFYNGVDCGLSVSNVYRDNMEKTIFKECLKRKIKMVGICRGLQFLNVMAGGKMWQHITNHTPVLHSVYAPAVGTSIMVNSFHHQMVELPSGSVPILWAQPKVADVYFDFQCQMKKDVEMEIEAAVYPELNAFGVQYHPEDMSEKAAGRRFFISMVRAFLSMPADKFASIYGGEHGRSQNSEG